VLVCHGNVIRYLVCRALGVDTKAWGSMGIRHASITEVFVRADGAVRLVTYGDAGFQPPALQSTRNIDVRK
jgi:serine/threonine-protein phosphatase PGAM5